jgi:hypothetical protein
MATFIADRSVAGLTVGCLDMELIDVEIAINVKYSSAYSTTVTSQLIEDEILSYLSPLEFTGMDEGWSEGDVASRVMTVSGVLYVESCTFSVASGNSNTGTAYSSLYQVDASGNVKFLAKGVLPSCTSANLTKTLTAVTVT